MADPDKKISAPKGSHFLLTWSVPVRLPKSNTFLKVKNTFALEGGGSASFDGPPPAKNASSKDVEIKLSVSKDGADTGFPKNVAAPTATQKMNSDGTYYNQFTCIFTAGDKGTYLFKVLKPDKPDPYTEEVDVTDAAPTNDKRQAILDIINDWFPSSTHGTQKIPSKDKIPDGDDTKDILGRCGWFKDKPKQAPWTVPRAGLTLPVLPNAVWTQSGQTVNADGMGNMSAAKKSYNAILQQEWQDAKKRHDDDVKAGAPDAAPDPGPQPGVANGKLVPVDTSCIAVMGAVYKLWGNEFKPDLNLMTKPDASYVKANDAFAKSPPQLPKPGDILFLSIGQEWSGFFGHTCIFMNGSEDVWTTADGGGGTIPDQTATVNDKKLAWTTKGPKVPLIMSVTDGNPKALHGWVDIDKVPNSKYDDQGKKKP
jgi:hypothetical protein